MNEITVRNIYIHFDDKTGEPKSSSATLNVPGLGQVEIKDAIPHDIAKQASDAATQALKSKLGQKL